jgi:hypothetical protein
MVQTMPLTALVATGDVLDTTSCSSHECEQVYRAREATPDTDDVGGSRADVLAVGPDGKRVALEAQLAPMTAAVGEERTASYAADSFEPCGSPRRNTPWLYEVPGVKIGPVEQTAGRRRVSAAHREPRRRTTRHRRAED